MGDKRRSERNQQGGPATCNRIRHAEVAMTVRGNQKQVVYDM